MDLLTNAKNVAKDISLIFSSSVNQLFNIVK